MRCRVTVATLAAAVLLGSGAANAQVTTPARDTLATVSFDDLAFGKTRMQIDATQTNGAGSSGTKDLVSNTAPSWKATRRRHRAPSTSLWSR